MTGRAVALGLLSASALLSVELLHLWLRPVAQVAIPMASWVGLLLRGSAAVGPLALSIAGMLLLWERLRLGLRRVPESERPLLGAALQACFFWLLWSALLLNPKGEVGPLQQALAIAASAALGLAYLWLRHALQGRQPAAEAVAVGRTLTDLLALGYIIWFLHQGHILDDLADDKFGVQDSFGWRGTLVSGVVPLVLATLVPALQYLNGLLSNRRWRLVLVVGTVLPTLLVLQSVNTFAYSDDYAHYHRVLSLLALAVALWVGQHVLWSLQARVPARGPSTRATAVGLCLLCLVFSPFATVTRSNADYVAAIHTVWLRMLYDVTGPVRRSARGEAVAPKGLVRASSGNEHRAYERRQRDLVLFLIDAQPARGWSLQGDAAQRIPRTASCFEGAFEFHRAYSAGTCTEVAFPALHSSSYGATRGQVRHGVLATKRWLDGGETTNMADAMSALGYRTVLVSDTWYNERFFDEPRWSKIFGEFDHIIRPDGSGGLYPPLAAEHQVLDGEAPLLLVLHINPHFLSARPIIDETIGETCDLLKGKGRFNEAVLLLTADHGVQYLEHGRHTYGRTLFDEEARVPMFLRLPGLKGSPQHFNLSFVDHLPSLLDLQGASWSDSVEGQSYLPVLLGAKANPGRPIFIETRMDGWGSSAVVRGDLKLVRWHTPAVEALFDLARDPGESVSVLDDPALQRDAAELRGWLDQLACRSGDCPGPASRR